MDLEQDGAIEYVTRMKYRFNNMKQMSLMPVLCSEFYCSRGFRDMAMELDWNGLWRHGYSCDVSSWPLLETHRIAVAGRESVTLYASLNISLLTVSFNRLLLQ